MNKNNNNQSELQRQMQKSMEKQRQMQQIQADAERRFNVAIKKKPFPSEKLSDNWWTYAKQALQFASPIGMGCTAGDLENLFYLHRENVTMYDFAMLSNNLESRSMADLRIEASLYFPLMGEVQKLSEEWNVEANKIKAEIGDAIQQEIVALQAKKSPGMHPVKAEA